MTGRRAIHVIDDDAEQGELLGLILRRSMPEHAVTVHVFDPDFHASLADGTAIPGDGSAALVVADAHLPGCPIADLVAAVRRQDPGLPVVVVTGADDPALQQAALGAGAAGWFAKPFRLLEARALTRELSRLAG